METMTDYTKSANKARPGAHTGAPLRDHEKSTRSLTGRPRGRPYPISASPIRGIILLIALLAILAPGAIRHTNAQTARPLSFFAPVQGRIDDTIPAEDWTFDGFAGQVISLLAVTTSGDLDPVIQVIGPDGVIAGRNDDLDSLVTDAGLEAFALPLDGAYTVRVSRYQGAEGVTAGGYDLTLTPGFAHLARQDTFTQAGTDLSWVRPDGQPVPQAQGRLQMRPPQGGTEYAFPPEPESFGDFYLQASARLFGSTGYAEFGLVYRMRTDSPGSYQFRVNTNGEWTVLAEDASGQFVLRSWTAHPALGAASEWSLAVLARGNEFAFFANGALLGTLTDSRLPEPGITGVVAGARADQPTTPAVLFDNVLVTTRLGTTYQGLPLALTAWDSADPKAIVDELVAAGQINPASWHDLFLFEKRTSAETRDTLFELIGTPQAEYADFLFGVRIAIVTGGESVGCGIVFHWQDERNLSMAYLDTVGGFGLVQARDGDLTTNVYDLSPMIDPAQPNKLLIIVRGAQAALYVNGALAAQETLIPAQGRAGVALLNYETARTDCLWTDLWVWPLLPAG